MKRKIIAIARRNISKGEEIVMNLDNGKWKSREIRLYKQGQRFLSRFYKKIKGRLSKLMKGQNYED